MLRNWLVGGILFSLSILLYANENNEDYRTTLIAHTQLETERQQLFKEGLANVLEKLTLQPNLATNPEVKQAADHIMSFVDQYAYEGNQLSVQYSPALVKDLVKRLGGAAPSNQPSKVMLWCVVDETDDKRLIGEDSSPEFLASLKKGANQTGLTLVLPVLDLEDVSRISTDDVWALNMTAVEEASKRYGAETILIGRLHHQSSTEQGEWKGDWMLINPSENKSYSVQQGSLESVLKEGFAPISKHPKKSTPRASSVASSKSYLLLIDNIQTGQDFSRVETTLRSLSPVSRVAVAEVLDGSAIFEVTLKPESDSNTLTQAVSLSQNLVEEQMGSSRKVDLSFRFNR